MVFIILSKINGDEFSHRVGYKEKENFVAIMNDYIFYIFFILIFAFILIIYFINISENNSFKSIQKKFIDFILFLNLFYPLYTFSL